MVRLATNRAVRSMARVSVHGALTSQIQTIRDVEAVRSGANGRAGSLKVTFLGQLDNQPMANRITNSRGDERCIVQPIGRPIDRSKAADK